MKVLEVLKACKNNKYILLRNDDGNVVGYNCKVAFLPPVVARRTGKLHVQSWVVSFRTCDINEYINYKLPFITEY